MISVIVPIYNIERYLRQCIDSILAQTYQNLEILLIDDGSPDNCGKICEDYARIDSRIKVFHTKNLGLSAARNMGLRNASGEYIGFVDSDDWIEPDMFKTLLRLLEETGADISVCEMWRECLKYRYAAKSVRNAVYTGTDAIKSLVIYGTHDYAWNKLYKRECWTNIFFPPGHTFEDVATLYKVVLNAHSVSCTSKLLYHYRKRRGSIVYDYSMGNLMDNWNARFDKYSYLSAIPEIKNDRECIDKLEERLATVAAKIWRWAYGVPKAQRDYVFLNMVSCFARTHFPVLGYADLNFLVCINIFLTRYANDVLFAFLYALNKCYIWFDNKKKY